MRTILVLISLLVHSIGFSAPIRYAHLQPDGILNVNAALGIATIIQLPETIQSIIIGDQSGFKVEYLDKAVTIKPLRWGAKTNLYLVTQKQRYNLRLSTERQESADYIVYVQTPKAEDNVVWRSFEKQIKTENFTLELLKIGKSKAGFLILSGRIHTKENRSLKPEYFWVYQNKQSMPINGLYLSSLKVTPKHQISFGLSLASTDLTEQKSITLDLKTDSPLSIEIPGEALWK